MIAILYFLTIIIFAFGQVGRFAFGGGLVIQTIDVFVMLTVSVWLVKKIIKKETRNILRHEMIKPIALFAGVAVLSLVFSVYAVQPFERIIAAMYLIRWISYAGLFFVVNGFSKNVKKNVFRYLLLAGSIIVFIGFIQYAFYPNLRNLFYLGWDDHLYRLFSVFFDPNFAATLLSLVLFALFPAVIEKKFPYFEHTLLARGMYIITFIALLLTYSRSGYLMFGVGMTVSLILAGKRKLIIGLLAVLAFGIIIIPKNLGSSGVELWRTASIIARTESAGQALEIFMNNPILGVGFNAYRYAQREYGYDTNGTRELSHSGAGTDNSFIFVLATTGIIGFVAYVYFWIKIIKISYSSYKNAADKYDRALTIVLIASIAGLFINSMFINSLFYPHVLFWFWSMFGLMERRSL